MQPFGSLQHCECEINASRTPEQQHFATQPQKKFNGHQSQHFRCTECTEDGCTGHPAVGLSFFASRIQFLKNAQVQPVAAKNGFLQSFYAGTFNLVKLQRGVSYVQLEQRAGKKLRFHVINIRQICLQYPARIQTPPSFAASLLAIGLLRSLSPSQSSLKGNAWGPAVQEMRQVVFSTCSCSTRVQRWPLLCYHET